MKNIALILSFLAFGNILMAQDNDLQWFDNMDEAKTYAAENRSNILMVFAGSDWCKPCIKFKKDILEAADFQNWTKEKMVVLYLDFPAKKKNKLSPEQTSHNEALAEQFNKSGVFPNIFLIDANAKVLANPKFKGQSAAEFTANLERNLKTKN
ncbi:MAG: thioredoxin-related protein [Polaribacter sp.]|jgi:thioredoxin-related protein